ncbi:hypothetical protein FISHEDRAFT_56295 [Fistulina hepatica ATCC 64428]|uniref:Uncharacterized protein n=1 Tax=Fistulina hepatica ATCC 64428 TaxID=1128425 RepID=A0A0D7AJY0_9AGAR|nr:hypothetical protein FISHEDRAFT_56295 [Fistulina hepatica ATCC 64428]
MLACVRALCIFVLFVLLSIDAHATPHRSGRGTFYRRSPAPIVERREYYNRLRCFEKALIALLFFQLLFFVFLPMKNTQTSPRSVKPTCYTVYAKDQVDVELENNVCVCKDGWTRVKT